MCGVAGFAGVSEERRVELTLALGIAIDKRGGDAIGFCTYHPDGMRHGRTLGTWWEARERFVERAADGNPVMLHARWTTAGKKDEPTHAHPFPIRRDGKVRLYGAHNGMLYNADDSAKRNGREYTVDSKELFELLADDNLDGIGELSGYGVISWMKPKNGAIYLCRLSHNADIACARLKQGGYVYGSTKAIVQDALDSADLDAEVFYSEVDPGQVFVLTPEGFSYEKESNLRVNKHSYYSGNTSSPYSYGYDYDRTSTFDWAAWARSERAKRKAIEDEFAAKPSDGYSNPDDWENCACPLPGCFKPLYREDRCFAHWSCGDDYVTPSQAKLGIPAEPKKRVG